MKKLTLALIFISHLCSAQYKDSVKASDMKVDRIELHLAKYDQQLQTGKAFFYTGGAIMAAGSAFLLSNSPDKINIASAIGAIGGAFTVYGFFTIADSNRHRKKVEWYRTGVAQK